MPILNYIYLSFVMNWKDLAIYFLQAAVVVVVLIILVGFNAQNIEVPIVFNGDALHHLAITKSIIETGWWWNIRRLSAPFELNMVLFPVGGTLDYFTIKFLTIFSDKPGTILNIFWIWSVVITAASATWSMKRLGIATVTAFVTGVLYAFLPHAFFRNIGHLMLVFYLVPPMAALAILLMQNKFQTIKNKYKYVFYIAAIFVGLNYIYTAFFSCFVLVIAWLYRSFLKENNESGRLALKFILIIIVTSIINLAPTMYAWKNDPLAHKNITRKSVAEADIYGMKLRQLITPIPGHPLLPWRRYEENINNVKFPLENENAVEKLGTTGSVGFLLLLGVTIFGSIYFSKIKESVKTLEAVASLNIAVLLFATIGGFGSIFNLLVSPDIRTYNRIAVFTAFFSFLAVGLFMSHFEKLTIKPIVRKIIIIGGVPLLLIAGILDQFPYKLMRYQHAEAQRTYNNIVPFVKQLETILPRGAMVYQLPYVTYPHTPAIYNMLSHQHFVPYIVSDHLRWSWPALSSNAILINQRISDTNRVGWVNDLAIVGFDGIWVDRFGYKDNAVSVLADLAKYAPGEQMLSMNGRYAFINLVELKHKINNNHTPQYIQEERAKLLDTSPPVVMLNPLPDDSFKAEIQIINLPEYFTSNKSTELVLHVKNTSNSIFSSVPDANGKYAIHLAYRWINSHGKIVIPYGQRTLFIEALKPENQISLNIPILPPVSPGKYTLEFDLVQEGVAWFGDKGMHTCKRTVQVK